jgi:hypothetical protein
MAFNLFCISAITDTDNGCISIDVNDFKKWDGGSLFSAGEDLELVGNPILQYGSPICTAGSLYFEIKGY